MWSFKCTVLLVSLLHLLSHGETKTIVFNSYGATVPSAPGATLPKDETDAATRQETRSESTGRAFSSSDSVNGFPFSIHPNYLSKPVQVARPVDDAYQTPKYIYPSYSDSSRNSRPYYDGPVAMDRFAPGEAYGGTIYKLKKQKLALQQGGGGGPFASIPAASFNSPVSVVAPTALRPAASDNSPVNIPAPPGLSSNGSPPSPAMPSVDAPPMPSMDGPPRPTIIAPTPNPSSGEDSSTSHPPGPIGSQMDSSEILLFPPNSHTGYLPPDKKAPKPDASRSTPAPLGVLSKNPVTSYLRPPSGTTDSRANAEPDTSAFNATVELFKFPPNEHAGYLPPISTDSKSHSDTSYLPPPSGDPGSWSNLKPISKDAQIPGKPGPTPKGELFKFPPNTDAAYLPPPLESGGSLKPSSDTSYLPPPSGDPNSLSNLKTMSKGVQIPDKSAATPAAELYKFPPNSNTAYLPPSLDSPKSAVTSYLPPPSGSTGMSSAMGSGPASAFKFPPNTNANYLPPAVMELPKSHATSYLPPPSGNPNSNYYLHPPRPSPAQSYIPPASLFKFPPNINSQYLPANNSPPRPNNAVTSYLPPASGIPGDDTAGTIPVGPGKPQYLPPYYADSRPPPPPPVPMKMPTMPMMPMMPPMMQAPANMPPMDGPPTGPTGMDHDHDHHHHHHDHDFPYLTGFDHDHYPDIIYDHDHFHHHHDEPTTTPAPPPPPPPPPVPETPRLKNYSYYYISRTLWYVPLYFTLYFCFYVTALILRSIARHKVNIPNEWTSNQRSLSSLADLSDAQTRQKATMLATFTMKQIEDFREKYL